VLGVELIEKSEQLKPSEPFTRRDAEETGHSARAGHPPNLLQRLCFKHGCDASHAFKTYFNSYLGAMSAQPYSVCASARISFVGAVTSSVDGYLVATGRPG
jgi:hypothetical protein